MAMSNGGRGNLGRGDSWDERAQRRGRGRRCRSRSSRTVEAKAGFQAQAVAGTEPAQPHLLRGADLLRQLKGAVTRDGELKAVLPSVPAASSIKQRQRRLNVDSQEQNLGRDIAINKKHKTAASMNDKAADAMQWLLFYDRAVCCVHFCRQMFRSMAVALPRIASRGEVHHWQHTRCA